MWSIKTVIRKSKPLADGTHAVFVRLTIAGQVAYAATGIRVTKKNFNDKTGYIKIHVPYAEKDNQYLENVRRKIQDVLTTIRSSAMTPAQVLKMVQDKPADFFGYANKYLDIRDARGQYGTVEIYRDHINQMQVFAPKLAIADITDDFVIAFIKHLRKTNNDQTIYRKIKFFSGIIRLAINDGIIKHNAFDNNNIKPGKAKIKDIPTEADLRLIINLLPSLTPLQRLSAHMYLAQFFTRGTRISDIIMLRHDQISDGKINFTEIKTKENKRVTITPLLLQIFDHYSHPVYVFPMCRWIYDKTLSDKQNMINQKREISTATSKVNKNLKIVCALAGIQKRLSTHTSRHGFATIAIQTLGGDIRTVQGLINHQKYTTTEGYVQDLKRSDYSDEEKRIYKNI